MAGFKFDFVFRPPARRFFAGLDPTEQAAVTDVIEALCTDPSVDGERKFRFPSQVVPLSVYDDDTWVILYRVVDESVVELWAIQHSDPDWRQRRGY